MHLFGPIIDRLDACPAYQKFRKLPIVVQNLTLILLPLKILFIILTAVYFIVSPIIAGGILASILAGLATGAGALPVLLYKKISERSLHLMLGWAAGVMLAATAFSLIEPGITYGNEIWPGKGIYIVALGMILGAAFLEITDRYLPHEKLAAGVASDDSAPAHKKMWLFIAAITLHNFPEGMAVGVSFGGGDWHNGLSLAIAIGMQNIPEGLAVALPLVALGYNRRYALIVATLTGLIEPVGGVLGIGAVSAFYPLLPVAMGFAAGAMLFVISDDIIPETQSRGKLRPATFLLIGGFVVMMILENILG